MDLWVNSWIAALIVGLKGLAKERKEMETAEGSELGFNEDLYLPRAVFLAMVEAGEKAAIKRLLDLGVEI